MAVPKKRRSNTVVKFRHTAKLLKIKTKYKGVQNVCKLCKHQKHNYPCLTLKNIITDISDYTFKKTTEREETDFEILRIHSKQQTSTT
jgi:hypothetical protein